MKPLLHTEGLRIGHGPRVLQEDVRFGLEAGTLTALLGTNGIGKSTLLRTLAGLHAPLGGRVLMEGEDLTRLPMVERARRIAIVLTGRTRAEGLDVRTAVALGRSPWTGRWGRMSALDHELVEQALQLTGAQGLQDRMLVSLSDGEAQKVLLARALAQDTRVVLLDEPTAFLDLPNRVQLLRTLRQAVRDQGRAVLLSTHDLQLALDLCDGVLLMQRDRPLWQGTPAEAVTSGMLELVFAGTGISFDPGSGAHHFGR